MSDTNAVEIVDADLADLVGPSLERKYEIAQRIDARRQAMTLAGLIFIAVVLSAVFVAVAVSGGGIPGLSFDASGLHWSPPAVPHSAKVISGDVLLSSTESISCDASVDAKGALVNLDCDFTSYSDNEANDLAASNDFMRAYSITAGQSGTGWCIAAPKYDSTDAIPDYSISCGTPVSY